MASFSRCSVLLGGMLVSGAPSRARTCDLLIRSQTLYPTELRVHGRHGSKILLALKLLTDKLHHVRDFGLGHLVFEGRHRFFAVRDHVSDMIVFELGGVV